MVMTLCKIASLFRPNLCKTQRICHACSSILDALSFGLSSSLSNPSSHCSSHDNLMIVGRDLSIIGSSKVLIHLKSWLKQTKSVAPEGFFNVDVGQEKKIHYTVPIMYLSHEDLQKLFDDSEAEFGHSYVGALQLSFKEDEFQEVLETIQKSYEHKDDAEDERQRLIARKNEKLY